MKSLAFATLTALALGVIAPIVQADEVDKKTDITVNETILIPGRTLPPGKYVIKLLRATANRNVVQIFNEDQTKLQATILAMNNYRLTPTDKTVLQYWETPAGSPPALRAWFAPHDEWGQEFAYPKDMAEKLAAANNNAKVPSYAATGDLSSSQLDSIAVENMPPQQTANNVRTTAAKSTTIQNPLVAQAAEPAREPTLLAQNQPAVPPTPANNVPTSLPQTASSFGWGLAVGLACVIAASGVRILRKV